MFIRKKTNNSGSISIQIIKKVSGKNIVLKTVGCSKDKTEIELLIKKAQGLIPLLENQYEFDFGNSSFDESILSFIKKKESFKISNVGPELVLGQIFNTIGFDIIKESLFKELVLSRLVYPGSKLKTIHYLKRHKGINISVQSVYDFLDKLHAKYKEIVEEIVFKHTKRILKTISIVFYDMTTIYFEAEDEDDLRKIGFSKDGKFQKPQIMLGLLVGEDGYPIGYDIFKGNTFEGHTLLPIIEKTQSKYKLKENPIVTADSGLLSKINLNMLMEKKYKFIIGARIKNEEIEIKNEILKRAKGLKHGDSFVITKHDKIKLIVSYSDNRAKKDKSNREKGIKRLNEKIILGKLNKTAINNRGYNKFLRIKNKIEVEINEIKVEEDKLWDGLKGYITNTNLNPKDVIANYAHLWKIEKAFRISKTDLRIRPIYHYRKRRIEAHICICFVAYAIWKELERLLKKHKINMTPEKAIEQLETIYQAKIILPESGKEKKVLVNLSDLQERLIRVPHS
jgi:transposase